MYLTITVTSKFTNLTLAVSQYPKVKCILLDHRKAITEYSPILFSLLISDMDKYDKIKRQTVRFRFASV